MTRILLLYRGYKPPFDIPDEWWHDEWTRAGLLIQGYQPPFDIPKEWWDDILTRPGLLDGGYEPPFDTIPEEWWDDTWTRQSLRHRGYPPPHPYSAEESTSQETDTDQHMSQQDQPFAGGETLSTAASPSVALPPLQPVVPAQPATIHAGRRRRGFWDSLKKVFRR